SWPNLTVRASNDSIRAHQARMHGSTAFSYRKGRMEILVPLTIMLWVWFRVLQGQGYLKRIGGTVVRHAAKRTKVYLFRKCNWIPSHHNQLVGNDPIGQVFAIPLPAHQHTALNDLRGGTQHKRVVHLHHRMSDLALVHSRRQAEANSYE